MVGFFKHNVSGSILTADDEKHVNVQSICRGVQNLKCSDSIHGLAYDENDDNHDNVQNICRGVQNLKCSDSVHGLAYHENDEKDVNVQNICRGVQRLKCSYLDHGFSSDATAFDNACVSDAFKLKNEKLRKAQAVKYRLRSVGNSSTQSR
ncbi:hypothetical protein RIF29_34117 [Crotalaria pallida]|uniref:Uncharacterized protein n=1 Tax=Crotalaria pallida TaxID=3830 RepID=A0AAN9E8L8_CROPI